MRFGSSQKQPWHLRIDLAHPKTNLGTCDEIWLIAKTTLAPENRFGSSQNNPWHLRIDLANLKNT